MWNQIFRNGMSPESRAVALVTTLISLLTFGCRATTANHLNTSSSQDAGRLGEAPTIWPGVDAYELLNGRGVGVVTAERLGYENKLALTTDAYFDTYALPIKQEEVQLMRGIIDDEMLGILERATADDLMIADTINVVCLPRTSDQENSDRGWKRYGNDSTLAGEAFYCSSQGGAATFLAMRLDLQRSDVLLMVNNYRTFAVSSKASLGQGLPAGPIILRYLDAAFHDVKRRVFNAVFAAAGVAGRDQWLATERPEFDVTVYALRDRGTPHARVVKSTAHVTWMQYVRIFGSRSIGTPETVAALDRR